MTLLHRLPLIVSLLVFPIFSHATGEPVGLFQSGDRVALVGNTVIERARLYGKLETAIQLGVGPEVKNITIRNLGWSGDSVFADSRSYFGQPQEGRDRLDSIIGEIKPNVVLLCYGTGAAMSQGQRWTEDPRFQMHHKKDAEGNLELFLKGYQEKIDRIRSSAGGALREIVLVSPPPLENLGSPLPDQTMNNKSLAMFRDGIRDLAEKNDALFVDWFGALGGDTFTGEKANPQLTDNGVHYSEAGYEILAKELAKAIGYPETASSGANTEELTAAIVEKNRLFFHRWRPANETYLFLFRKHEQGQNAKEIPMFDPLIAEEEKKIEAARVAALAGKP